jgi:hypothetical protein
VVHDEDVPARQFEEALHVGDDQGGRLLGGAMRPVDNFLESHFPVNVILPDHSLDPSEFYVGRLLRV